MSRCFVGDQVNLFSKWSRSVSLAPDPYDVNFFYFYAYTSPPLAPCNGISLQYRVSQFPARTFGTCILYAQKKPMITVTIWPIYLCFNICCTKISAAFALHKFKINSVFFLSKCVCYKEYRIYIVVCYILACSCETSER